MSPFDELIDKLIKTKNRIFEKIKIHKKSILKNILLTILFTIILIILLSPWWIFMVWPEKSDFPTLDSNDIICWINYPGTITIKDEKIIELTLTNNLGTCIPKVKAYLVFSEKLPIVFTSSDGSSIADFGSLKAKETKSKRIKFYLKRSNLKSEIKFNLRVICNNKEENKKNSPYQITIIPIIGHIKTYSIPLLSMLMLIFIPLLTEKLKLRWIEKR
jgi:hypothetical protein